MIRIDVDARLERLVGKPATLERVDAWGRTLRTAHDGSVLGALCAAAGTTADCDGARATLRWAGIAERGESILVVCVALATRELESIVVEGLFGAARKLAVPADEGSQQTVALLLETIASARRVDHEQLAPFVLQHLPADPLERSLGRWVLDHVGRALEGPVGDVGGVATAIVPGSQKVHGWAVRDGVDVAQTVQVGDRRAELSYFGFVGADAFYEPEPAGARASAALEVVERWRALARSRQASAGDVERRMEWELGWPHDPYGYALAVARHGPCGPRPAAGRLGEFARASAARLRALAPAERPPAAKAAYAIGRFAIALERWARRDDDYEDEIWDVHWRICLRAGDEPFAVVAAWFETGDQALSADGDEPLFRLFTDWLRLALDGAPAVPELAPLSLTDWLLFRDRFGDPLDHRIDAGRIDGAFADFDLDVDLGAADVAAVLLRAFAREIIDPDARFARRAARDAVSH